MFCQKVKSRGPQPRKKKTKQNVERGTGESRQYLVRLCDRDRVVRVIFLDLEVVAVFIPETSVRLPPL